MGQNCTHLLPHLNGSAGQAQTLSIQTRTAAESQWFLSNGNTNCSHLLQLSGFWVPGFFGTILTHSTEVITRKAVLESTTAPQIISRCPLKRAFPSSADPIWLGCMIRYQKNGIFVGFFLVLFVCYVTVCLLK